MANDKELLIRVRADIEKALADLKKLTGEVDNTGKKSKTAAAGTNQLGGAYKTLAAAATYLTVGTAIKALRMADEFNQLQQRIKTATKETGDFIKVSRELYQNAQDTGTAMADTVSTFQRLALARKELNATNGQILTVTKAVQQLGVMSGASGAAMQAGLMQFGQAMSSGVVRAEEFNSILENIPAVADRIAKGLGLSVGQLRQAVLNGEVLSTQVFQALLDQSGEIGQEFGAIPDNLTRASNNLANATSKFLSDLDQASNTTSIIAKTMGLIAESLENWGDTVNPQGAVKFNQLFKERLRLTQEINRLEKDIADKTRSPYVDYDKDLKNLKSQLEEVNAELKKMQDENVNAQAAGVDSADKQSLSAKDYEKSLKDVNLQLKNAIALQKQQTQMVEASRKAYKDLQVSFSDVRTGLSGGDSQPNIIDISSQSFKSEQLFKQGDFKGAIEAAEKARDMIEELGDAGGESEIVLRGLLTRAEQAGLNAAASINAENEAMLQNTNTVIANLLAEAEKLKALKVGLDTAAAQAQANSLLTALQAQFSANPLVIPVTLSQSGGVQAPSEQPVQEYVTPLPIKRATGGPISGPGTGRSDSILMWGSNGEFMQPEASVKYYGQGFMELIRRRQLPRFADGGLIGAPGLPSLNLPAPTGGGGTPINLYLDGKRYPVSAASDVAADMQREFRRESLKRGDV